MAKRLGRLSITSLINLFVFILISALVVLTWQANKQFLCVAEQMMDGQEMGGCLITETESRPYFATLANVERNALCEFNCPPLTESDDVRQQLINYYHAVAMNNLDVSNAQKTLPSSIYLWSKYYRLLSSDRNAADKHRRFALAVDDVWLYPWHKGEALLEEGRITYEAGQFETAEDTLATAINELQIDQPIGDRMQAKAWFLRAKVALERDDLQFARTAVTSAIAIDPENNDYLTLLEQITQE